MKLRHLFGAFLLFFGAATAAMAKPDSASRPEVLNGELKWRYGVFDRVKALVDAKDFVTLNAMERTYRTTRARTESGIWKLSVFHRAVHAALPAPDPNQGCQFAAGPVLKAWATATPSAPMPYIASATMLFDQAWCFRGDGYAQNVADDAWEPFREKIAAADKVLTAHRWVVAHDPQVYVLMEDIYRSEGRGRAEFQQLLDQATAKEPYYYDLYEHAYLYNLPQWFGSYSEIERVAQYEVSQTRTRDGLGAYARYYWSAIAGDCGCWVHSIDWATMKQAMKEVAKRYPDPWNLANFAKIGCAMNDSVVAREYFIALGDDDGSTAWPSDPAGWQQCRELAGSTGGPLPKPTTTMQFGKIER